MYDYLSVYLVTNWVYCFPINHQECYFTKGFSRIQVCIKDAHVTMHRLSLSNPNATSKYRSSRSTTVFIGYSYSFAISRYYRGILSAPTWDRFSLVIYGRLDGSLALQLFIRYFVNNFTHPQSPNKYKMTSQI